MKKMTASTLVRNWKKFPRRPRFTFAAITGMFLDRDTDDQRRPLVPAEQLPLPLPATKGGAS